MAWRYTIKYDRKNIIPASAEMTRNKTTTVNEPATLLLPGATVHGNNAINTLLFSHCYLLTQRRL